MLDTINVEGESCPGAETCREKKGPGNLWKYPDADEDDICRSCKFYKSKPERMPDELKSHAATATDLSELQRSGASFQYPAALSPAEWSALTGLTRGNDRAEAMRRARDRKKPRGKK